MRVVLLILLFVSMQLSAQTKSEYGVEVIEDVSTYREQVEENPKMQLVSLKDLEGIYFDIRYATKNNFVGEIVYPTADAFARKQVAEALQKANSIFAKKGLAIKIFDAYRPYAATVQFYELVEDTTYVASPYSGSRHNRGCAVDLTLVDKETGEDLNMPTSYDHFSEKAHPTFMDLEEEQLKNRQLLIEVMESVGFKVYPYEWWHFDFIGWEDYPLMNLSFEELKQSR